MTYVFLCVNIYLNSERPEENYLQGLVVALNWLYWRLAGVTSGLKFHSDGVRLAEGVLPASIKGTMKAVLWICNYVFWIRIREIVILNYVTGSGRLITYESGRIRINSELRIRNQEAK
jgi:hypothetical protein